MERGHLSEGNKFTGYDHVNSKSAMAKRHNSVFLEYKAWNVFVSDAAYISIVWFVEIAFKSDSIITLREKDGAEKHFPSTQTGVLFPGNKGRGASLFLFSLPLSDRATLDPACGHRLFDLSQKANAGEGGTDLCDTFVPPALHLWDQTDTCYK